VRCPLQLDDILESNFTIKNYFSSLEQCGNEYLENDFSKNCINPESTDALVPTAFYRSIVLNSIAL
jgi:hypothetical protein